ncbi:COG1835 Predicted acyltransferases [Candidatus Planktophila versatilis]|uniref:Acyltransferase n=1 Tax=Candidatus Planktophila versatilis TaxID=1884905 RepID=A0AAC9YVJ4_9ACTN|nr:acyltransferase family protein [Candidatus Planktophila versatilis]ASY22206.1 acyltransferase [Candidatus Planktophila versatilis]ASY26028.1 acyltransferase [Candidatus Planktophila versatilis]
MAANRGIQYIPAIDGLRALAVIAVMLYHLGFNWIPGGFLGVDLFFVISGYVITRLLLDSIEQSGGLDLRGFYLARARRLLPALIFTVTTTTIAIGIWAPDTIKRLLTDMPFSLTGTMNWWLVARHQDYFESIGRPPLLQHTWSLAVEAQFYLLWPLILYFILKRLGKSRIPIAALVIAAASGITLLLVSFSLDASNASKVSHVYFGTDTHSIGLFLGAALAVSWIPQNFTINVSKKAQDFIDGIGVFGFIGIIATFLLIDESKPTLYKIAFPLAGLFGASIIMSVVHPASRFAPILQNPILVWIGQRSYAMYLWHWIIFQVTRPSVDLAGQMWALYALRILIVFALADISLRYVEQPIRRGALKLWLKGLKYRTRKERSRQTRTFAAVFVVVLALATVVSVRAVSIGNEQRAAIEKALTAPEISISAPASDGLWVTGDSVILGIRSSLGAQKPISVMNARIGRQAPELLEVMQSDKAQVGNSPVIFNLGNNGVLNRDDVQAIFELVKDQPQVIVVNTAVSRPWRDGNNALVAEVAQQYSTVTLIDWNSISMGHPEYFAPDGIHLVPTGVAVYVGEILKYLK